jgi:prolipoprotein diacylglyceryltransferase
MAIGRVGDVVNGEHHATACAALAWCVRYTHPNTLGQRDFVHPAVAYELVADLAIFAVLLVLLRREHPPWTPTLAFLGLYGAVRLLLSPFRLDPPWLGPFSEAQAVSAAFVLLAIGGLMRLRSSRRRAGHTRL